MYNPSQHRKKGDKGEEIAQKFLENLGYKTLVKNYCIKGGEIDLIMQSPDDENETIFVEVKTRYSNSRFGSVYESDFSSKIVFYTKSHRKIFLFTKKRYVRRKISY